MGADVLSQHHLGLVLQVLHLFWILQAARLCAEIQTDRH